MLIFATSMSTGGRTSCRSRCSRYWQVRREYGCAQIIGDDRDNRVAERRLGPSRFVGQRPRVRMLLHR